MFGDCNRAYRKTVRIGKRVFSDSRHTQRSSEPAGSGFLVKDSSLTFAVGTKTKTQVPLFQ